MARRTSRSTKPLSSSRRTKRPGRATPALTSELRRRCADITLLALDVDGVLTDGSIMIDDLGNETKRFNVRDGLGLTTWKRMGFEVAIITRRCGKAVQHRMRELGITHVIQGSMNKGEAIATLAAQTGIPATRMAFVGDDWPDLSALTRVGLPVAVGDADERVKAIAAFTTTHHGGNGAVREVVELLLAAKGLLDNAIAPFR